MQKISRQNFLRLAAAAAMGSVAAGALTGCGASSSTAASVAGSGAAGVYTAGTYTATVKGYSSYITVEMTFSESAITACTVNAAGETPSIGTVAAEELAGLIVKDQSVDSVTTATANITLPAVRKAAENCIAQAQGTAVALNENSDDSDDWLGQEPQIEASDIASTQDTELLIIGAGNGGMMAAATAADAGLDFIVCEQNETVGDTRYWIGAIDTPEQAAAGVTIQKDRLLNEIARYASYKCDMSVIKAWIKNSAEMLAYLKDKGLTCEVHVEDGNHVGGNNMEYYVPSIWHTLHAPEGSEFEGSLGCIRNPFLEHYINEKGYEIQYKMSLVRLVESSTGAVTGAIFSNEAGEYVQINAKNVILATGGYPGNPKMVKALAPIVNECVTANSYFGPDTGMGIRAGIWAGAKRDVESAPMIFDRGLVAPGVKAGYTEDNILPGTVYQFNPGTQPHLKVNKEGYRFANESCPYDFFSHAASLQTDGVYAMIVDANVEQAVAAYDQYGCAQMSRDMARAGTLLPMIEQYVEQGLIFKADTIEELAGKLGIPEDTLADTVARYNELAAKGVDEDFGKEAYRLRAVDTPPYYGCFLGGSLLTTCDGLRINNKCQVYNTEHKVIEGLYCVGDCSGSFFSGNYPEYFVGVAVGRTMTQGRYAVKAILGEEV